MSLQISISGPIRIKKNKKRNEVKINYKITEKCPICKSKVEFKPITYNYTLEEVEKADGLSLERVKLICTEVKVQCTTCTWKTTIKRPQ